MTANLLLMTPLKWGVWGVINPNIIFYFSHNFRNFVWCSPELSQRKYLTGVPRDVIFQMIILFDSVVATSSSRRNSRNNGCTHILRQCSNCYQLNILGMDQSCPQKCFLPDFNIFCTSSFWLYNFFLLILRNYHKSVVCLSAWNPECHTLDAIKFLKDVGIDEPHLCPFHAVGQLLDPIFFFVIAILNFLFLWKISVCLMWWQSSRRIYLCLQL